MTQAETRVSTPRTNTSATRRSFLSTAATLAAGSAALAVAIPPALAAHDPIFAAIEAHRAAFTNVVAAIDVQAAIEDKLPKGIRSRNGEASARWIECKKAVCLAWEAEEDAAIDLVNIRPTTIGGISALLNYAVSADRDGETWPPQLLADDGETVRSWHNFILRNLAEILPGLLRETTGGAA
jgi:hypothetical protein